MGETIKIIGVIKEEVGRPRNDGTAGSALYKIPLRLSDTPSHRWAELFARNWDRPPSFSSMHRPRHRPSQWRSDRPRRHHHG